MNAEKKFLKDLQATKEFLERIKEATNSIILNKDLVIDDVEDFYGIYETINYIEGTLNFLNQLEEENKEYIN